MAKNTVATKNTGDQLTAAELNEIASVQNTNDDLRAAALSAANAAQADATQAISDAATAQSTADSKLTQAQVDTRIQGSSFTVVDGANELTFDVPHEYTDAGNVLVGGDPSFTLAASGNVANTYKTVILDQPTTITLSADFEYEGQGTDPLTLLGTTYDAHVFTILMRYDEYQDKVFYVVPLPQASTTDITLPTVTSATVEDADPDALVVVFSEAVTVADVTGLSLDGSWTGISVSSVTSGSGTATVTFALSGPIAGGESGNFVYGGTNTIDDLAGNSLAAGSTAVTNNVAASFTGPGDINANHLYYPLSVASTNATTTPDSFTTVQDQLNANDGTTDAGGIGINVYDGEEGANFDGSADVITTTANAGTWFAGDWSVHVSLMPDDGQPTALQAFMSCIDGALANNRVQIGFLTSGKLDVVMNVAGGSNVAVETSAAAFINGQTTTWKDIDVVWDNTAQTLTIYIDQVSVATTVRAGTLGSLDFTNFVAAVPLRIGARFTDSLQNYYDGRMRNFIMQPVAYTQTDVNNLGTL